MNGKCIVCKTSLFKNPIMEIQNMPYGAQHLPDKTELNNNDGLTLHLCQCRGCGLIQLDNEPVEYYRDVIRSGGFSNDMINVRRKQFSDWINKYELKGKKIVEVGCGAGEFVSILNEFPVMAYGIEHDDKLVDLAKSKGLKVIKGFAEDENTCFVEGPFDAFISFNFIEHQPFPNEYLQAIYSNTSDDAIGLITIPDSKFTFENSGYYDLIRDHIAYYDDKTAQFLLELNGFEILEKGLLDIFTLSYVVKKKKQLNAEKFVHTHDTLQKMINSYVANLKDNKKTLAVWGASHQCLTITATTDLRNYVEYIIDSAPFKQGKYSPVSHLPIVSPDYYFNNKVDAILILAYVYEDEIAEIIRRDFGKDVEIVAPHAQGGKGIAVLEKLEESLDGCIWKEQH